LAALAALLVALSATLPAALPAGLTSALLTALLVLLIGFLIPLLATLPAALLLVFLVFLVLLVCHNTLLRMIRSHASFKRVSLGVVQVICPAFDSQKRGMTKTGKAIPMIKNRTVEAKQYKKNNGLYGNIMMSSARVERVAFGRDYRSNQAE